MAQTRANAGDGKALLAKVAAELGIMYLLERHCTAIPQFGRLTTDQQLAVIAHLSRLAERLDFRAMHTLLRNGFRDVEPLPAEATSSANSSPLQDLLSSLGAQIGLGGYPQAALQYDELTAEQRKRFNGMLEEALATPPHTERSIARARQLIGLSLNMVATSAIASPSDVTSFRGHDGNGDCPLHSSLGCPHDWAVYIAA